MQKLAIILLTLLLPWTGFAAEEAKPKKQVKYYRFYPDFVTNLKCEGDPCYLLTRVEVSAEGDKQLKLVKDNEPLLRDELILFFNGKTQQDLAPGTARKTIKKQALELLRAKMKKETGDEVITKILFTKFQTE